MTDPIELCKRGTAEIVAYACGTCGSVVGSTLVHGDAAHAIAATHCGPWICRVCGVEHDWSHQTICHDCWRKSRAEREAERDAKCFATATKLSANKHPRTVQSSMRAHMAVCHREYDKGRRKLPNKEWM